MPEGVGGFVAPQPVKPRTNKTEIQSTLEAGAEYATFKNAMEARKEAGLTQEDIAERMGTTQSSVARLEMKLSKGILPSHTSLVKYASALGKRVVITFV